MGIRIRSLPRKAELSGSGDPDIMSAVRRIAFQQDLARLDFLKGDTAFQEGAHFKRLQRRFHKTFAAAQHKAGGAFRVNGSSKAVAVARSILQSRAASKR